MVQLSKRLLAVANMVTSGHKLADVGTDHGYIPIYLMEQKRITKAIAMDIHHGPLKRAQENISAYKMEDYIETRCSDGVEALKEGEVDSIVIAGMGGCLITTILTKGETIVRNVSELILQPQSEIEKVRYFLQEKEYRIVEEDLVLEDGKFYPIMKVCSGYMERLSDIEALYGPYLLKQKNKSLKLLLDRQEKKWKEIQKHLEQNDTERSRARIDELKIERNRIQRAKESML